VHIVSDSQLPAITLGMFDDVVAGMVVSAVFDMGFASNGLSGVEGGNFDR
jgi:hypothetical protein